MIKSFRRLEWWLLFKFMFHVCFFFSYNSFFLFIDPFPLLHLSTWIDFWIASYDKLTIFFWFSFSFKQTWKESILTYFFCFKKQNHFPVLFSCLFAYFLQLIIDFGIEIIRSWFGLILQFELLLLDISISIIMHCFWTVEK